MEPLYHRVHGVDGHVDGCFSPRHLDPHNGDAEPLREGRACWVGRATTMRDATQGRRRAIQRVRRGVIRPTRIGHGFERVWFTELPKGSDNSSIRDGGMYN